MRFGGPFPASHAHLPKACQTVYQDKISFAAVFNHPLVTRINIGENGAPGEIRTPGLLVRSQTLYPAELRAPCVFDNLYLFAFRANAGVVRIAATKLRFATESL